MTTGFFGKIPATGDFVSWNLPRVFIERWDRWMSMELRDRPETGDLNPRIWRFAVGPGIFGDQPCAGAWRMSEDRVGRRYPFAIVRIGQTPDAADPWFDALAKMLERCVEDGWSSARVQERLEELPPAGKSTSGDRIAFWTDDWEVNELVFADIYDLADNGLPAMRQVPAVEES